MPVGEHDPELVAGALSGDARTRAHLHIKTCAACRTLVVELARDDDLEAQLLVRTPVAAPYRSTRCSQSRRLRAPCRREFARVHATNVSSPRLPCEALKNQRLQILRKEGL